MGLDSQIWFKLGQILILSVTALLVFLLVVRPMIRRLTTPVAAAGGQGAALPASHGAPQIAAQPGADGSSGEAAQIAQGGGHPLAIPRREGATIDVSQIEGQVRESAVRKVGDVVQAHPEEAMAILRTWLHQPV